MTVLVFGIIPAIPIAEWFIAIFKDNSVDKEHLEKFKKAIDGDMPIKQYKNKGYKMNSVYYQISIYDKKNAKEIILCLQLMIRIMN